MNPYRVFISYSHEDIGHVQKIVEALQELELTPLWDEKFVVGQGFQEQISNFIAHAHIFLPLLTERSSARGWVHQEIGYAMALKIPVLPVCVGRLPGEMLEVLHAVCLKEDLSDLPRKLNWQVFDNLVTHVSQTTRPLYECAMYPEERARMLVEYSRRVRKMGFTGCVRQAGPLSSFQTPNKRLEHPIWRERYGQYYPGDHHCERLREERMALESHASQAGCKLIVALRMDHSKYGNKAMCARFRVLIDFLKSMPDEKVVIAVDDGARQKSLVAVGDWFMAESMLGKLGWGYHQSTFTRHSPTIRSAIDKFDQEIEELLQEQDTDTLRSRETAIELLKNRLEELSTEEG